MHFDDGALVCALDKGSELVSLRMSLAILRGNADDAHAVELLHRVLDLRLGRVGIDFEAVPIELIGGDGVLLGDQRLVNDAGGLHESAPAFRFGAERGLDVVALDFFFLTVVACGLGASSSSACPFHSVPSTNACSAAFSTTRNRWFRRSNALSWSTRMVSTSAMLRAESAALRLAESNATRQERLTPTASRIALNALVLGSLNSRPSKHFTSLSTSLARSALRLARRRIFLGMSLRKSSWVRSFANATPPPLRRLVRTVPMRALPVCFWA